MSRMIIGIHGLGNKPPYRQLEQWWKAAILEGLGDSFRYRFINFSMVYWASLLYPQALDPDITDEGSDFFLREPYVRGAGEYPINESCDQNPVFRKRLNEQLEKIFIEDDGSPNFSRITDFIIRHFLKDLDAYFNKKDFRKRDEICGRLAESLYKNRRKKIMLVAHSMGSIIAWDVLTRWISDVNIDTLVTIGSPLGNPVVKSKLISEYPGTEADLRTPDNITRNWYNLADFKDLVAINYILYDDYLPNRHGVQPQDKLIWNNYIFEGERNPHKSYGYLRCPEMAWIISEFYSIMQRSKHTGLIFRV